MASEAIKRDLIVHCEVKILTHIFETEAETPDIPKAYTYIGVSKLCCRGCHSFFESFNAIHATCFTTKGPHNKSYWPWQFPQSVPGGVLFHTYLSIAERWIESYSGYTVKWVSPVPDSDAQSGSHFDDEDEDAEAIADVYIG